MADSPKKPNAIPNKVIDLLVSDVFQKNNVDIDSVKKRLSDGQKQTLKELVEELSTQVNEFVNQQNNSKKEK